FDTQLLEGVPALFEVRDHRIADLPLDLVVRVCTRRREESLHCHPTMDVFPSGHRAFRLRHRCSLPAHCFPGSRCFCPTVLLPPAFHNPQLTFARSYGIRPPDRFTTCNPALSTRSNVVYLRPHAPHSRRRLTAAPSSASLESMTRSSELLQYGQRMFPILFA